MSFSYQLYFPILDVYGGPILMASFVLLLLLEFKWPLRRLLQRPLHRLVVNSLVAVPTMLVMRLAMLPILVIAASYAEQSKFGLLQIITLPSAFRFIAGFLLLDYLLYLWHVLSHKVPFIWRFHNVHHTDLDLSVSTGIRFHFGEMLMSAVFRSTGVLLIGTAPSVILIYEVVFEAWVAFQHSNWRLPFWLERLLVSLFVTPRMHGIHHSNIQSETNSNFSNFLNVWDRVHGTLRLNVPQDSIIIGVPAYKDEHELSVISLLTMPFLRQRNYWQSPHTLLSHEVDGARRTLLSS